MTGPLRARGRSGGARNRRLLLNELVKLLPRRRHHFAIQMSAPALVIGTRVASRLSEVATGSQTVSDFLPAASSFRYRVFVVICVVNYIYIYIVQYFFVTALTLNVRKYLHTNLDSLLVLYYQQF